MTEPVNSRGQAPAKSYLDEKSKQLAYIRDMGEFLDRRNARPDPTWTEADRDEYKAIWEKHYGKLVPKAKKD